MTGKAWRRSLLDKEYGQVYDCPFLPLGTVVRMLRAAYLGDLSRSPVRLPDAFFLPGRWPPARRLVYERQALRGIGAHQLLAHGFSLERAAKLIRNIGDSHRGSPLSTVTVAGFVAGGRFDLALMAERGCQLQVQPAGWRPG